MLLHRYVTIYPQTLQIVMQPNNVIFDKYAESL